jgi:IS5 family transposase
MEAKLYKRLYQLVQSTAHVDHRKREQYSDKLVVIIYFWAVIHDRPVSWACAPQSWPKDRDFQLISQSRMSRRLRTVGVLQLIERLILKVSDLFGIPLVKQIDSKPLIVGAYSKDVEAKRGRLADGQFGRGYRLHTVTHGRAPRHFVVLPLNEHDSVAAPILLPKLEGGGYVVADNAYDTNDCYKIASSANHQLVAPPRACNKGVRDVQYNCAERLRGLDIIDSPLEKVGQPSEFGRELYNCRQQIESGFGGLTLAGLGPLPAWVRGPRRVALWTAAKILVFLCRQAENKGLMT